MTMHYRILQLLDLRLPSEKILRQWPQPLSTVGDMVMWVNWILQQRYVDLYFTIVPVAGDACQP